LLQGNYEKSGQVVSFCLSRGEKHRHIIYQAEKGRNKNSGAIKRVVRYN